jgi:hypothetical protein
MADIRVRVPDAHAWRGTVGLGQAWRGGATPGEVGRGLARRGWARQGIYSVASSHPGARPGHPRRAWQDVAWQGGAGRGQAGPGGAGQGRGTNASAFTERDAAESMQTDRAN